MSICMDDVGSVGILGMLVLQRCPTTKVQTASQNEYIPYTSKYLLRRYDWTLQTHPKHLLRRYLEA